MEKNISITYKGQPITEEGVAALGRIKAGPRDIRLTVETLSGEAEGLKMVATTQQYILIFDGVDDTTGLSQNASRSFAQFALAHIEEMVNGSPKSRLKELLVQLADVLGEDIGPCDDPNCKACHPDAEGDAPAGDTPSTPDGLDTFGDLTIDIPVEQGGSKNG